MKPEKRYKCEACGRAFVEAKDLRRHFRSHTGEKPYECIECEKCFARADQLKTHMKVHTGGRTLSVST